MEPKKKMGWYDYWPRQYCAGKSCTDPQCHHRLKDKPFQHTTEFKKQKHVLPKLRAVR